MVADPLTRPTAAWSRRLALLRAVASHVAAFAMTLLGATLMVLVLLTWAPGDAIDMLPNGEEVRSVLQREWGLDQPLWTRWATFASRAARLDLGTSLAYRPGAPVVDVLAAPAARSATWFAAAMALSVAAGTLLAALPPGRWRAPLATIRAASLPPLFLAAHLAVNGVNEATWRAIQAGYLARPDWFALPDQDSWVRSALAVVLLAFASGGLADVHGAMSDVLRDVRGAGYVDHARTRGLPVAPHVLSNMIAPLAGVFSSRAAFYAGGLVIVEKVLLLQGVGSILWEAAQQRDVNVALGATLFLSALVAGARLLADVARAWADPRLRDAAWG